MVKDHSNQPSSSSSSSSPPLPRTISPPIFSPQNLPLRSAPVTLSSPLPPLTSASAANSTQSTSTHHGRPQHSPSQPQAQTIISALPNRYLQSKNQQPYDQRAVRRPQISPPIITGPSPGPSAGEGVIRNLHTNQETRLITTQPLMLPNGGQGEAFASQDREQNARPSPTSAEVYAATHGAQTHRCDPNQANIFSQSQTQALNNQNHYSTGSSSSDNNNNNHNQTGHKEKGGKPIFEWISRKLGGRRMTLGDISPRGMSGMVPRRTVGTGATADRRQLNDGTGSGIVLGHIAHGRTRGHEEAEGDKVVEESRVKKMIHGRNSSERKGNYGDNEEDNDRHISYPTSRSEFQSQSHSYRSHSFSYDRRDFSTNVVNPNNPYPSLPISLARRYAETIDTESRAPSTGWLSRSRSRTPSLRSVSPSSMSRPRISIATDGGQVLSRNGFDMDGVEVGEVDDSGDGDGSSQLNGLADDNASMRPFPPSHPASPTPSASILSRSVSGSLLAPGVHLSYSPHFSHGSRDARASSAAASSLSSEVESDQDPGSDMTDDRVIALATIGDGASGTSSVNGVFNGRSGGGCGRIGGIGGGGVGLGGRGIGERVGSGSGDAGVRIGLETGSGGDDETIELDRSGQSSGPDSIASTKPTTARSSDSIYRAHIAVAPAPVSVHPSNNIDSISSGAGAVGNGGRVSASGLRTGMVTLSPSLLGPGPGAGPDSGSNSDSNSAGPSGPSLFLTPGTSPFSLAACIPSSASQSYNHHHLHYHDDSHHSVSQPYSQSTFSPSYSTHSPSSASASAVPGPGSHGTSGLDGGNMDELSTHYQAPKHTLHHPASNPLPLLPPAPNASTQTLASSTFGRMGSTGTPGPASIRLRDAINIPNSPITLSQIQSQVQGESLIGTSITPESGSRGAMVPGPSLGTEITCLGQSPIQAGPSIVWADQERDRDVRDRDRVGVDRESTNMAPGTSNRISDRERDRERPGSTYDYAPSTHMSVMSMRTSGWSYSGHQRADEDASVRAIRRRGSWESGESRFSWRPGVGVGSSSGGGGSGSGGGTTVHLSSPPTVTIGSGAVGPAAFIGNIVGYNTVDNNNSNSHTTINNNMVVGPSNHYQSLRNRASSVVGGGGGGDGEESTPRESVYTRDSFWTALTSGSDHWTNDQILSNGAGVGIGDDAVIAGDSTTSGTPNLAITA